MVLTLVEPQSSGIGTGAFPAPAAADENVFLLPDGKPMPFIEAMLGGR